LVKNDVNTQDTYRIRIIAPVFTISGISINDIRDPKNYSIKPDVHAISPYFSAYLNYYNSSRGKSVTSSSTLKNCKNGLALTFPHLNDFLWVPAQNFIEGK